MFCKYCGKELPDNAKFCSKCGKQLIEVLSQTADISDDTKIVQNKTEDDNLNKGMSSYNERSDSVFSELTERSQKESRKKIIIIACILVIIIPVGLKVKKEIDVQSYKARMWPVCVSTANRAKEAISKCVENPTIKNEDAAELASLDTIEAYLDYYRGMVAMKGKGDYSDMNEQIEGLIVACENIHRERGFFGLSEFDSRMTQIRAEWRAIKQQY